MHSSTHTTPVTARVRNGSLSDKSLLPFEREKRSEYKLRKETEITLSVFTLSPVTSHWVLFMYSRGVRKVGYLQMDDSSWTEASHLTVPATNTSHNPLGSQFFPHIFWLNQVKAQPGTRRQKVHLPVSTAVALAVVLRSQDTHDVRVHRSSSASWARLLGRRPAEGPTIGGWFPASAGWPLLQPSAALCKLCVVGVYSPFDTTWQFDRSVKPSWTCDGETVWESAGHGWTTEVSCGVNISLVPWLWLWLWPWLGK